MSRRRVNSEKEQGPRPLTLWIYCDGREADSHAPVSIGRLSLDAEGLLRVRGTAGPISNRIATLGDGSRIADASADTRAVISDDLASRGTQERHTTLTLRCHRCHLDKPMREERLRDFTKKAVSAGVSRAPLRSLVAYA